MQVKIVCTGAEAHASTPDEGVNAICAMAELISKIERHRFDEQADEYFEASSRNIGTITGGTAANVVAGACEVMLDMRYLKSQTKDGILEELKTLAESVTRERNGISFTIESALHMEPMSVSEKSRIVRAIQKWMKKLCATEAAVTGIGGTTVAKQLYARGTETAGWSVDGGSGPHVPNEWIGIDELMKFAEVAACVSAELVG